MYERNYTLGNAIDGTIIDAALAIIIEYGKAEKQVVINRLIELGADDERAKRLFDKMFDDVLIKYNTVKNERGYVFLYYATAIGKELHARNLAYYKSKANR